MTSTMDTPDRYLPTLSDDYHGEILALYSEAQRTKDRMFLMVLTHSITDTAKRGLSDNFTTEALEVLKQIGRSMPGQGFAYANWLEAKVRKFARDHPLFVLDFYPDQLCTLFSPDAFLSEAQNNIPKVSKLQGSSTSFQPGSISQSTKSASGQFEAIPYPRKMQPTGLGLYVTSEKPTVPRRDISDPMTLVNGEEGHIMYSTKSQQHPSPSYSFTPYTAQDRNYLRDPYAVQDPGDFARRGSDGILQTGPSKFFPEQRLQYNDGGRQHTTFSQRNNAPSSYYPADRRLNSAPPQYNGSIERQRMIPNQQNTTLIHYEPPNRQLNPAPHRPNPPHTWTISRALQDNPPFSSHLTLASSVGLTINPSYQGDLTPLDISNASCPPDLNCAIRIENVSSAATLPEIFSLFSPFGKIFSFSIKPPIPGLFTTSAARLVFTSRSSAAQFISRGRSHTGIVLHGYRWSVKWNRDMCRPVKYEEKHQSRVIRILGPADEMNVREIEALFHTQIKFEAVETREWLVPGGGKVVEIAFASILGQSRIAFKFFHEYMERWGLRDRFSVSFGPDPCDGMNGGYAMGRVGGYQGYQHGLLLQDRQS